MTDDLCPHCGLDLTGLERCEPCTKLAYVAVAVAQINVILDPLIRTAEAMTVRAMKLRAARHPSPN